MADGTGIFRARNAEGGILTKPCPSLWFTILPDAATGSESSFNSLARPLSAREAEAGENQVKTALNSLPLFNSSRRRGSRSELNSKVMCLTALITSL